MYTVLFKIPNEEAIACTSSDDENQTIYRKKANKRKMEKCLFEHTKNKPFGCNKELTQGIYQCERLTIQQYLF